jgi:hypothetical protein
MFLLREVPCGPRACARRRRRDRGAYHRAKFRTAKSTSKGFLNPIMVDLTSGPTHAALAARPNFPPVTSRGWSSRTQLPDPSSSPFDALVEPTPILYQALDEAYHARRQHVGRHGRRDHRSCPPGAPAANVVSVPGIGPIISSAMVAAIGNGVRREQAQQTAETTSGYRSCAAEKARARFARDQ